ncbi:MULTISPECIES: thioredoxin [Helicobacter]|uniref:Thioredoxin n=1 Tax=Helicobacter typhlonius TaxID=76936 RepID=A0A099UI41_9HELI|nr:MULTISPECIES: thioredoxin [Helicobacter]TLD78456.1 thioredoxin [Helicobacter typhlonius]TLD88759.1 thioredoxin [Helicobacter sp. MIT 03-1616]CUU39697.1 Thioredoxin [Helicobacter typhlonius]
MGKYIELSNDNFDAEVMGSGVALVDFWAPWCNPCKMLSPVIDKLAESYEGKAKICKVNVDNESELSKRFGIRNIPTILFFKDGEIKEQVTGAKSEDDIRAKLDTLL